MSPLLTDLYQLTMAHGYWKSGLQEAEACFHLFFRQCPFDSGYAIASGLEAVVDYIKAYEFQEEQLTYLASLTGHDGKPLFVSGFLDFLRSLRLEVDVDAIPEGTVVFGNEPLIRVKGPLIQAQLLESSLLALVNFPTLIATKAARVCRAAQSDPVFEFGMRRAQGIDGGVTASRAAYVGGCVGTSNVLAGQRFGIPVKGTHAHSWVQVFTEERKAFATYAETNPNNCVLLVDTYNTLEGVRKAIETGQWLREQGQQLLGIRLDSGDLAYLSIEARKLLDAEGFSEVKIFASNELDEHVITECKGQGAKVDVWGVGTHLVTAYDEPALGGVYKISSIKRSGQEWVDVIKLSEQMVKVSSPGIQQVRRYYDGGEYRGDLIYDVRHSPEQEALLIDPLDSTRTKKMEASYTFNDLLQPIFRQGKQVFELPSLDEIRAHSQKELGRFHDGVKRFLNPHQYPVGISSDLYHKKLALIREIREREG